MTLSAQAAKSLRGAIVRLLGVERPRFVPESTLIMSLHTLQQMPPHEELVNELDWLRERGYIESKDLGTPGASLFSHKLTGKGHELMTGERVDEHVWVMK